MDCTTYHSPSPPAWFVTMRTESLVRGPKRYRRRWEGKMKGKIGNSLLQRLKAFVIGIFFLLLLLVGLFICSTFNQDSPRAR